MSRLLFCLPLALVACSGPHDAAADGEVTQIDAQPSSELATAIAQSDVLRSASAAIDSGHPWRATQLLSPVLRDPAKKSSAALLLAARAAADWGGWSEVDKLIGRESWLDSQFEGKGRELLTRSALERDVDTTALRYAKSALTSAKSQATRATRLVLLARALERNNYFDSAAAAYARAADSFRPIRDWLRLRVAGSVSDSAKRAAMFAGLTLPAAKARVVWTDAQARERFADALGAAARYASVGGTVQALRLRLSVAPDTVTRNGVKTELLGFIRAKAGTADAKAAVEVLDKGGFPAFTPDEELIIARSSAASGPVARAVTAFERSAGLLTPRDRMSYASALSRAGRSREAIAQLEKVDGALAGQAAYQRARIVMTSSTGDATRAALRDVVARFAADTEAASAALYLLADLSTDIAADAQAKTYYQQLYHDYPTSARAPAARFHAAVITLAGGDAKQAALAFDSLVAIAPRADDALAARYWAGRAWAQASNKPFADARWKEVIAQSPTSYYSFASAQRLGVPEWTPKDSVTAPPRVAAVDSAMARAALLERLGMDVEARFEYEALEAAASSSTDRALATATALLASGQSSRAMRIAQKLADGGLRDARVYRLLFPIVDRDELERAAKARNLDPALVAGLIRQESSFNPRAISVANARGLMQLLPSVGQEVARNLNFPVWHPALLFDADANLQLGTAHLASYMKQYGALPRVLAAYNAGGSRVERWVNKAGSDDPELFVERIPYVETRDYVRIVQRNARIYEWILASEARGRKSEARRQKPEARK
jgi:soluble lytic murein transglycosylase